jgi:hypothetical protein
MTDIRARLTAGPMQTAELFTRRAKGTSVATAGVPPPTGPFEALGPAAMPLGGTEDHAADRALPPEV